MRLSERFSQLPEYAFTRLRTLLDSHQAGGMELDMSVGGPKHDYPNWVVDEIVGNAPGFGRYPRNEGSHELLSAISKWIQSRYSVDLDPETRIVALNGSREGLFNACLALCPEFKNRRKSRVLIPNPFYQVYAAAALAAGAEPVYVPATKEFDFLPRYDTVAPDILDGTAVAFLCSPSNPQGAVASRAYLEELVALGCQHDFLIFADECYSEIYRGDPPVGALEVAESIDPERIVAFNSLSKRSSLPGLRCGYVAGGREAIAQVKFLRAYSGAPMPNPLQSAAARLWRDERHVEESRSLYQAKFELVDRIFSGIDAVRSPEAGFFLWLPVPDDEAAAVRLWSNSGVRVLPGRYLGREFGGENPGSGYIRVALVNHLDELERGLREIRNELYR